VTARVNVVLSGKARWAVAVLDQEGAMVFRDIRCSKGQKGFADKKPKDLSVWE